MDSENVITKNINLAVNYIDLNDVELKFDSIKDETFKEQIFDLFQKLKDEPNADSRDERFDEVRKINN